MPLLNGRCPNRRPLDLVPLPGETVKPEKPVDTRSPPIQLSHFANALPQNCLWVFMPRQGATIE